MFTIVLRIDIKYRALIIYLIGLLSSTTYLFLNRFAFYINVPIEIVTIIAVFFLLPLKSPKVSIVRKLKQIDYLGVILLVSCIVCILVGLDISPCALLPQPDCPTLTLGIVSIGSRWL